uniref:Caspase family p20 domain-containing protein n=1 Tax=Pectinophora gossypiella TaxID=13191 RepID=A0A1E1WR75_PECGO
METFPDINPFNLNVANTSQLPDKGKHPEDASKDKVKFDPESLYYDMTGEKYLFIFNHEEFDPESTSYYRKPPEKRTGTDEDVKKLKITFDKLGFKIEEFHNKKRSVIWDTFCRIRATNYSKASCFCVAILTHGLCGGDLCAYDTTYPFSDVLKLFESHPTLAGKPKLFFIQACRGRSLDDGNKIGIDGAKKDKVFTIPSHADFLIIRSTVEDYLSYRDCRGSWMIQELCKAIMKYPHLDILHLITLVQREVAYGYATNTPGKTATHNKRQMPETTFTLTKFLKF